MQRTMSSEELTKYTSQVKNPSEAFKLFLYHYVTGSTFIRSRGEEDVSVWDKLKGDERKIAIQLILDELKIVTDISYIRAVGYFRDERAIPILVSIIETYPEKYIAEKLLSAKVLRDWIGYNDYVPMLESACRVRDDMVHSYLKYSLNQFVTGLSDEDKARITKALADN